MRTTSRSGLTLIEILVALAIFLTISGIMLGVLLGATNLFRSAETSRAANDEVMAVFGLLERDLARAVPQVDGGEFYAGITNAARGTCAVGWTIANTSPDDDDLDSDGNTSEVLPTLFVHWGVDPQGNLRREVLRSINGLDGNGDGNLDLTAPTAGNVVARGVRMFTINLVGTSHAVAGSLQRSTAPEPETWWRSVIVDGTTVASEPPAGDAYATVLDPTSLGGLTGDLVAAPIALRATLILSGGTRDDGTPRFGFLGRVVGQVSAGDNRIPVVAARGIPSQPGSVAIIGNEIVGFHRVEGNQLVINSATEHGPLGETTGTGRGIFRSSAADHSAGAAVEFGRLFTLTRLLPQ